VEDIQIALKMRFQGEDIALELILDIDFEGELSDDKGIYHSLRDTDTMQTYSIQWTNCAQTRPPAPTVHRFTRAQ
jgi:hypothetical protein